MIDIFRLTKSKTRQRIFAIFLENSGKDFYLRELERKTHISAGNLRRELSQLLKLGLFTIYKQSNNTYYRIDQNSPYYKLISQISFNRALVKLAFMWVYAGTTSSCFSIKNHKSLPIPDDYYCPTRDIFQARLESQLNHWETQIGENAYLLTAVVGEIGNNSYDHNLGSWPDVPGTLFASDLDKKIVIVADRGLGILTTIRFVKPTVQNHREALKVAFSEIISGRKDEHRGNGLKFVRKIILEKNWRLQFYSGDASVEINSSIKSKRLLIKKYQRIHGCLAVIKY